jgi:hypothetical protein
MEELKQLYNMRDEYMSEDDLDLNIFEYFVKLFNQNNV